MNSHVSLHIWRVPRRRVPRVLWRVARDRGRLRRTPGVRFAKLLGTGEGRAFGPIQADSTRWAALIAWDGPVALEQTRVVAAWRALATAYCRLDLTPLASRGTWAGQEPFQPSQPAQLLPGERPILVLTRARLRPTHAAAFWHAIAPVAVAAATAPGLLATFGIGEAPIGWQGTVSLWRSRRDLVEFAYRQPDHRRAIEGTTSHRWYAETLFTRFVVEDVAGDRDLIGWTEEKPAQCGIPSGPYDEDRTMRTVR